MILSDNETKIDMLNNRAIAKTVVGLIEECDERPISIGVHGDWGAGKSSVLAMIEEEFAGNDDGFECIRFNGWKHQGFEDSKIALMSAILSELIEKRKLSEKCKDTIKKLWKNINWLSVVKAAGGVALSAATGMPPINLIMSILGGLKETISDKDKVNVAVDSIGQYLSDARVFEDISLAKEFTEFQKSFEELLAESRIKKLVVLIDDLDRCLPRVTIETLEAVRLFLFSKSTAFVIAADEEMIEYAVRNHFPDFSEKELKTGYEYSQRYLEKLIQVPFRIPSLGEIESRMYIALLLIGSVLKEDDDDFKKLLCLAIEKMKMPWKNTGFAISELQETLGTIKFASIGSQFTIANQIADILAKNTQGNPRKIKRFINMLLLRKKISESRGFGDVIDVSILAKMMLAEHFFNERYKRIAYLTNEDGKCEVLKQYEIFLKDNPEFAGDSGDSTIAISVERNPSPDSLKKEDENPDIKEWRKSKDFTEWVKSDPMLGEIDLRPYFFASKEKEDFFSSQITSDNLRQLIGMLMKDEVVIASTVDEIKALSETDAKKVFDIIASEVLKVYDMSNQPDGIAGLREVTIHHPNLEAMLVNFIEMLDFSKVGLWICKGWDKAIKSPEGQKRLQEIFTQLKEKGNDLVRKALKAKKGV